MSAPVAEVLDRIAEVLHRPIGSVSLNADLSTVAADSFVLVEMVIELQDEFGVRFDHEDMANLRTVGDVVELVQQRWVP